MADEFDRMAAELAELISPYEGACEAGYGCGWVAPYGFVPEAGCPVHDPDEWPNCCIADCGNKVCTWGSQTRCYPHEEAIVGKAEMDRRYAATHDDEGLLL